MKQTSFVRDHNASPNKTSSNLELNPEAPASFRVSEAQVTSKRFSHRTQTYQLLQKLCNRAYTMEKLHKFFDLSKVLKIESTPAETITHRDDLKVNSRLK